MPFKVKYDDVTTYDVDVVVNSLGTKGNVYGKLCKNIISKAKDEKLKEYIDSQENEVGTILVTNAGKLKAKKIIHVVTPFKNMDNEKNELLIKAYKDCVNKALELGYKSIALPFIGTGANGYSDADAFDAIGDACVDVLVEEEKQDKDILDITVVGYLKPYNEFNKNNYSLDREESYKFSVFLNRNIEPEDNCCISVGSVDEVEVPDHPLINDMYDYAEEINNIEPSDLLIPSFHYNRMFDFYDDFVQQNNIYEPDITKKGFERYYKHRLRNAMSLKKIDIYRLSFLVGMNKAQIMQWMHIAGLTFSPLDPLDQFYWRYINGLYPKYDNFFEFAGFVKEKTDIIFTF